MSIPTQRQVALNNVETCGVQQRDSLYSHTEFSLKESPAVLHQEDGGEIPEEFNMTDATDILRSTEAPEIKFRRLEKAYLELMLMNEQLINYLKKSKSTIQRLKKISKTVETVCNADGYSKKESKAIDSMLRLLSESWMERNINKECGELQDLVVLLEATLAENRTFKSSAKSLTQDMAEKNNIIAELQSQLDRFKLSLVTAQGASDDSAKEVSDLRMQLESLQKLYTASVEQTRLQDAHIEAISREYKEATARLEDKICTCSADAARLIEERDSLRQQNEALLADVDGLQTKLINAKNNVKLLLAQQDEEIEHLKAELEAQQQLPNEYNILLHKYDSREHEVEALNTRVIELEQVLESTTNSYEERLKGTFKTIAEDRTRLDALSLELLHTQQELQTVTLKHTSLETKLHTLESQLSERTMELKNETTNHRQVLTVLEDQLKCSAAEVQALQREKKIAEMEASAKKDLLDQAQNELSTRLSEIAVLTHKLEQSSNDLAIIERVKDSEDETNKRRIAALEKQLYEALAAKEASKVPACDDQFNRLEQPKELFTPETASYASVTHALTLDTSDLQKENKNRLIEIVARLTLELAEVRNIRAPAQTDHVSLDPNVAATIAGLSLQLDSAENSISAHKAHIESLISEISKLRGETLEAGDTPSEQVGASQKPSKRGMCGQMVLKKSRTIKSRASSRRSSATSFEHSDAELSASDPGEGDVVTKARRFLDPKDAKDFELQKLKDKLVIAEEQISVAQLTILAKDKELTTLMEKHRSLKEQLEVLSINYSRLIEQHEKTVSNNNRKMAQQAKDNSVLLKEIDLLKAEINSLVQAGGTTLASEVMDSPAGAGLPPRQVLSPSVSNIRTQLQRSLHKSHAGDPSMDESRQYSMSVDDGTTLQLEEDDLPLPVFPAPDPNSKPYVDAPRRVVKVEQSGSNKVVYEDVELSDSDEYELVNIYSDLTVIEEELLGMITIGGSTLYEDEQNQSQECSTVASTTQALRREAALASPEQSSTTKPSSREEGEDTVVDNPEISKAFQDIKLLKRNITRYALAKEKQIRKLSQQLERPLSSPIGTANIEGLTTPNTTSESAKLRLQVAMRPDQTADLSFLQATIVRLEEEKSVLSDNYSNMECITKELMKTQASQEKLIDSLNEEVLTLRQRIKEQSDTITTKTETIESLTECISRHGEEIQQISATVVKERDTLIEAMKQEIMNKDNEIRCMQETIATLEISHRVPSSGLYQDTCIPDDDQPSVRQARNTYYVLKASVEKMIREKTENMDLIAHNIIDLQSQVARIFSREKITVDGLLREKGALQTAFDSIIADLRREQSSFMDANDLDGGEDTAIFSVENSGTLPLKSSKLQQKPASPPHSLQNSKVTIEAALQTSILATDSLSTQHIETIHRSISPLRSSTVLETADRSSPKPQDTTAMKEHPSENAAPIALTSEAEIEIHKLKKEVSMAKADIELASKEHEAEVRRLKSKIQTLQTELLETEELHEQEIGKLRNLVAKLREERASMLEVHAAASSPQAATKSQETRCDKCKDYDALLSKLEAAETELSTARDTIQELQKEEDTALMSRSILATSSLMYERDVDRVREQYEQEVEALQRQVRQLTKALDEQKKEFEAELEKMLTEVTEARSSSSTILAEATAAQLAETTAIIAAMENENKTLADLNIKLNNERQELLRQLSEKDDKLETLRKGADDASVITLKLQLKSAQEKNKVSDRRILDQSSVISQLRTENERLRRAAVSAGKGDKLENERLKTELARVQSTLERTIKGMNEEAQNLLSELAMLRAEHTMMKRESANEIERLKKELAAVKAQSGAFQKQANVNALPDLDMAAKRAMFELSEADGCSLSSHAREDFMISANTADTDILTSKFDKVILEITNAIETRNTLMETLRNNYESVGFLEKPAEA
ncbi:Chromosome segregation protein SMC [Giardia duodenalis]|uniref:Coiled-coil protein n=2 Tax=Giardia intestinalis TaxID=5741 RepID=C6LVC5_GIAIB|nr:Coiled-coil protein [Giardia intestinalis ATCC 50581]ESU45142.1 Chromosome segregation protein SMC [Giardia intestinalis]